MFSAKRSLRDPVAIQLDGEEILAERGEPLAVALLGADKTILARSPKLHRPRGPTCLRGACDGCLARVDGVPNVMTCQRAAHGGERIESQNVVGSRKADLLRVTDWFFAKGIDHHHLMAGVPGLGDVMQTFARKVAGLGRLPAAEERAREGRRLRVDAAVIGGGAAGITVASRVARAGRSAALIDDGISLGGAMLCAPRLRDEVLAEHPLDGVDVFSASTAAGVFDGELLVASEGGATLVTARALVFATGAHDGVLAVPGNDLPGVFSARALCRVLAHGVAPDGPVAVVGKGFWADELARALGKGALRLEAEDVLAVRGTGGVKALESRSRGKVKVAAVGLALPGAPAFELAVQAGAEVRADPALGYAVEAAASGRAAEGAWAVGECTGLSFDVEAITERAQRVADDVVMALRG